MEGLRRILNNPTLQEKICPVFMGTSFKNKGVQPLMNAIIDLLPSPTERPPVLCQINPSNKRKPEKNEPLTIFVFKVIYDLEKGPLAYARVYSGLLKKNMTLFNTLNEQS